MSDVPVQSICLDELVVKQKRYHRYYKVANATEAIEHLASSIRDGLHMKTDIDRFYKLMDELTNRMMDVLLYEEVIAACKDGPKWLQVVLANCRNDEELRCVLKAYDELQRTRERTSSPGNPDC